MSDDWRDNIDTITVCDDAYRFKLTNGRIVLRLALQVFSDKKLRRKIRRHLVQAIQTANNWSSGSGLGIGLLSLGTTRTIHSEEHRQQCLSEIDHDIRWNETWEGEPDEVNDPKKDIPLLKRLRSLVKSMPVGKEWLTNHSGNREA